MPAKVNTLQQRSITFAKHLYLARAMNLLDRIASSLTNSPANFYFGPTQTQHLYSHAILYSVLVSVRIVAMSTSRRSGFVCRIKPETEQVAETALTGGDVQSPCLQSARPASHPGTLMFIKRSIRWLAPNLPRP